MSLSVDAAKQIVATRRWKAGGCECPCCGQHCEVKRFRFYRSLASSIAEFVRVYDITRRKWVHIKDVPDEDHCLCKAAFWGLIEKSPIKRGYWRPTDKGRQFLAGEIEISEFVFLYNGKAEGFSDSKIRVDDVVRTHVSGESVRKAAEKVIEGTERKKEIKQIAASLVNVPDGVGKIIDVEVVDEAHRIGRIQQLG